MEPTRELVSVQRHIMLEDTNYGHWKVKMRHSIISIDEDAWTAVENGWAEPTMKDEKGGDVPKPKDKWTSAEKNLSKMNSRALSAIFNSIGEEQFKLVQGFNTAKEAWDELQRYYEGTTSVRRSRLDSLASKFENLRMEKDEKVTTFSAKISAIANEASVLGKKYKDKKLVKKFLRCLPEKFSAHKSAMTVSLDTDTMSFGEVVGMMKAHEMELEPQVSITQKGVAFAAATSENPRLDALERSMNKLVKSVESQNRSRGKWKGRGREAEKSTKNEKRCYECHGIGHFQGDCPTIKLRETHCSDCNGLGHAKSNCVSIRGGKDNSYIGISSETESESEEEDDNHAGFCAFPAIICDSSESESESDIEDNKIEVSAKVAEVVSKTHSDSEDEDEPLEYEDLARQLIELTKETIELIKEKELMKEELRKEKEKSSLVEQELLETKKKIQMLNSGTKDLEKILSMGRTEKANYGLGYGGEASSSNAKAIQFVRRNTSQNVPANTLAGRNMSQDVPENQFVRRNTSQVVPATYQNREFERRISYGCYYCGKHGHIKRHCYSFKAKVRSLMNQQRFYPNYRDVSYVYMRNEDLYKKEGEAIKSDILELKKNEPKLQQDNIKKYDKWYLSPTESEFLNELCQTRRGREVLDEGGLSVSN